LFDATDIPDRLVPEPVSKPRGILVMLVARGNPLTPTGMEGGPGITPTAPPKPTVGAMPGPAALDKGGPPGGGGIVTDPLAGGGGIIEAGGPAIEVGTDVAAIGAPVAVEKNNGRPTGALAAAGLKAGFALDGGGNEFGGFAPPA